MFSSPWHAKTFEMFDAACRATESHVHIKPTDDLYVFLVHVHTSRRRERGGQITTTDIPALGIAKNLRVESSLTCWSSLKLEELRSAMAGHFSAGSMTISGALNINIFLRIMSQAQKTTRGFQSQKNRGPHGILSRLRRSSSELKHGVCWFHVEVLGWPLSHRKFQTGFDTRRSSSLGSGGYFPLKSKNHV